MTRERCPHGMLLSAVTCEAGCGGTPKKQMRRVFTNPRRPKAGWPNGKRIGDGVKRPEYRSTGR